ERAGPEPVRGRGQRTDRADLDRVAREVGGERPPGRVELGGTDRVRDAREDPGTAVGTGQLVGAGDVTGLVVTERGEPEDALVERADLLREHAVLVAGGRTATTALQVDERVAGDLRGESRATLAQD